MDTLILVMLKTSMYLTYHLAHLTINSEANLWRVLEQVCISDLYENVKKTSRDIFKMLQSILYGQSTVNLLSFFPGRHLFAINEFP